MAIISASCVDCPGQLELVSRDLVVILDLRTGVSTYAFQCPKCGRDVIKAAPERLVELLQSAKVDVVKWASPVPEELDSRFYPPLTWDDALELHNRLAAMPTTANIDH